MLLAGGAAALYIGDIYLKSLGVVSIIAGPLYIYLDWRISKDIAEIEQREIETSDSDSRQWWQTEKDNPTLRS